MTTPLSVRLIGQDGTLLVGRTLNAPQGGAASAWTYCTAGLGCHVFVDGTLRISNGVYDGDGVGSVYFALIQITYDAPPTIIPRKNWSVTGNTLAIGTGQEVFPPRAHLNVRIAPSFDRLSRTSNFNVGALSIPYPASMHGLDDWRKPRVLDCLAHGTADSYGARMFTGALGIFHPYGDPLPNQGGGWDVEPLGNGWNGDSFLDLARHDLGQERQATDCLSMLTGEPLAVVAVNGYYSLTRGWSKVGQLPRFCTTRPGQSQYDDSRAPRRWNTGVCPYDDTIHGFYVGSQPGYLPHDGQHIVRALCYARAARDRWGDLCAAFDIRMMQQDALYAWTQVPTVAFPGTGSPKLGRRECAEVTSLCRWTELAQAAANAQMPNGGVMRCARTDTHGVPNAWGFIPDPWTPQVHDDKDWPPLSQNHDAEQLYERVMQAVAFAECGFALAADKALAPLYLDGSSRGRGVASLLHRTGGTPKWVAVGDLNGAVHASISDWCQWGDFISSWVGIGLGALIRPEYLQPMMLLPSPATSPAPTHPLSFAELKARLLGDLTARSQYVGALAAIARAGL